ncbi:MAG: FkbM family methyltransferase [Phycisphaeraceae bacterium]|nr:FkbM family methyltransferase [Phycisphaeraceae bacterium]
MPTAPIAPAATATPAADPLARIAHVLSKVDHRLSAIDRVQNDLRRRVHRLEACELQRRRGLTDLGMPVFRSQNGEDHLLWALLGDDPPGFFIEAGAYDGLMYSVSAVFEQVGWRGLLVEPLPDRAAECRANRPRSRVEQTALSRPGAPATATFTQMRHGEMLSYLDLTEGHRQRLARETDVSPAPVAVPVTTLDGLLGDHDGGVGFCVFDVEGGELALLEGFSVERWRPRVMLIEDNTFGRDRSVADHLAGRGYRRIATADANDVYIRADDQEMLARTQRLF